MFELESAVVTVVGLGLMGGSVALGLKGHCQRLLGVDTSPNTCRLAIEMGVVSATLPLEEALPLTHILILAAPVRAILGLLKSLRQLPPPPQPVLVIDLGSTKNDIIQAMTLLPDIYHPIGGHPMCGKELPGIEHAEAAMLRGATFALTPLKRTSPAAKQSAIALVRTLGSTLIELNAARHDRLVSITSHLPYLLACSAIATASHLGQNDPEIRRMMASGFRDTTRVSASDVTVMHDILRTNRIYVKLALEQNRQMLQRLEELLDHENPETLRYWLEDLRSERLRYFPPIPKPSWFYQTQIYSMIIHGTTQPLMGTTTLAGDKSISHRALLHAALSPETSHLQNILRAGVTEAMIRCLRQLGVQIEGEGSELAITGGNWRQPGGALDCGNSGTTIRLLMGALAGQPFRVQLTGTTGLQRRPMGRVADPLRAMGAQVEGNYAPLAMQGGNLRGIEHSTAVASAQVKAAILLAALQAEGPTTIHEPGPSRDHSERMLRALGIDVRSEGHHITLTPSGKPLPPTHLTLPGDFSSAGFLIGAALVVPGSQITVEGVGLNPTRTGLLDAVQAMGAQVTLRNAREVAGEPIGDLTVTYSPLQAIEIKGDWVVRMIDEFPIFAVIASRANGRTVVREAEELRLKESDRISVLAGELRKMGIEIEEFPDGFAITGPQAIHPAQVDSHGDHRLAMSLAIAGMLAHGQTEVQNAQAVHESFPTFVSLFSRLGARLHGN